MTFHTLGTLNPTLNISGVQIRVMDGSATGATNGGIQSAGEETGPPVRYSLPEIWQASRCLGGGDARIVDHNVELRRASRALTGRRRHERSQSAFHQNRRWWTGVGYSWSRPKAVLRPDHQRVSMARGVRP